MNIVQCDQGGAEWLQLRAGKVTASRVADAVSVLKRKGKDGREAGDSSAAREAYKAELVAEILSGVSSQHFVSSYMERGTELEPDARAAYELRHGFMVEQVGFVIHPTIERAGASPDGIVGVERGLEIKVPKVETHLKYLIAGVLPPEYEPQVMWNLACCPEIPVWDFLSYCPEIPPRFQQFRVEVPRDEQRIAELEAGVIQFLSEADALIARLDEIVPAYEDAVPALIDDIGELGITDADISDWYAQHGMEM